MSVRGISIFRALPWVLTLSCRSLHHDKLYYLYILSSLVCMLLQAPQAVIVAPTRELGVQIVMLIYKLLGGTTSARQPGDPANMFQYTGPRGIKVQSSSAWSAASMDASLT